MLDRLRFSPPSDGPGTAACRELYRRLNKDWQLERLSKDLVIDVARPDFYPNTELYRISVHVEDVDYWAFFVWSGRALHGDESVEAVLQEPCLLDGTSPPIHEVNQTVPISLEPIGDKPTPDEERRAMDYLHFFCAFVTGEDGSFLIIEDQADLPLIGHEPAAVRDDIVRTAGLDFQPVELLRVDGEENRDGAEPRWELTTKIAYAGHLFHSTMRIADTGFVELVEDDQMFALPDLRRVWSQALPDIEEIRWFRAGGSDDHASQESARHKRADRAGLLGALGFSRADPMLASYLRKELGFEDDRQGRRAVGVESAMLPFVHGAELYRVTHRPRAASEQAEGDSVPLDEASDRERPEDDSSQVSFFLWSGRAAKEGIIPQDRAARLPISLDGNSDRLRGLNRAGVMSVPTQDTSEARTHIAKLAHFLCALSSGGDENATILLDRPSDIPGLWEQIQAQPDVLSSEDVPRMSIVAGYGERSTSNSGVVGAETDHGQGPAEPGHGSTDAGFPVVAWRVYGMYATQGQLIRFAVTIPVVESEDEEPIDPQWDVEPADLKLPSGWQVWRDGLEKAPGDSGVSGLDEPKKSGVSRWARRRRVEARLRPGDWYCAGSAANRPVTFKPGRRPGITRTLATIDAFYKLIEHHEHGRSLRALRVVQSNRIGSSDRAQISIDHSVELRDIIFEHAVNLSRIQCNGSVLIQRCEFTHELEMLDAKIDGSLAMYGCHLIKGAMLTGITIEGGLRIRLDKEILSEGELNLANATVHGPIQIWKGVGKHKAAFTRLDMQSLQCNDSILVKELDLHGPVQKGKREAPPMLQLRDSRVQGSVYIDGVTASGGIDCSSIRVGINLVLSGIDCKNLSFNYGTVEGYLYVLNSKVHSDVLCRGVRCGWLQFERKVEQDAFPPKQESQRPMARVQRCPIPLGSASGSGVQKSDRQELDVGGHLMLDKVDVRGTAAIVGVWVAGALVLKQARLGSLHVAQAEMKVSSEAAEASARRERAGGTGDRQGAPSHAPVGRDDDGMPKHDADDGSQHGKEKASETTMSAKIGRELTRVGRADAEEEVPAAESINAGGVADTDSRDESSKVITAVAETPPADEACDFRECFVGLGVTVSSCKIDLDVMISVRTDESGVEDWKAASDAEEDGALQGEDRIGSRANSERDSSLPHPIGEPLRGMISILRCEIGMKLGIVGYAAYQLDGADGTGQAGKYKSNSRIAASPLVASRGLRIEDTTVGASIDLRDARYGQCGPDSAPAEVILRNLQVNGSLHAGAIASRLYSDENGSSASEHAGMASLGIVCGKLTIDGLRCGGSVDLGGVRSQGDLGSCVLSLLDVGGALMLGSRPALLVQPSISDPSSRVSLSAQSDFELNAADIGGHLDLRGATVSRMFLDDVKIGRDLRAGPALRDHEIGEDACSLQDSGRTVVHRLLEITELHCDGDAIFTGLRAGCNQHDGLWDGRAVDLIRSDIRGVVKFAFRPGHGEDQATREPAQIGGVLRITGTSMSELILCESIVVQAQRGVSTDATAQHGLPDESKWADAVKPIGTLREACDLRIDLEGSNIGALQLRRQLYEQDGIREIGYNLSGAKIDDWDFRDIDEQGKPINNRTLNGPDLGDRFRYLLVRDLRRLPDSYASIETWLFDRGYAKAAESIRKLAYEQRYELRKRSRPQKYAGWYRFTNMPLDWGVRSVGAVRSWIERHSESNVLIAILRAISDALLNVREQLFKAFGYSRIGFLFAMLAVLWIGLGGLLGQRWSIVPSFAALEIAVQSGSPLWPSVHVTDATGVDGSARPSDDQQPYPQEGADAAATASVSTSRDPVRMNPAGTGGADEWDFWHGLALSSHYALPMVSLDIAEEWRPSPFHPAIPSLRGYSPSVKTVANITSVLSWILWVGVLVSIAGELKRARLSMHG